MASRVTQTRRWFRCLLVYGQISRLLLSLNSASLKRKPVSYRYEQAYYSYSNGNNRFDIKFDKGSAESTEYVIVAPGYQTPRFKEWTGLPVEFVKGQHIKMVQKTRETGWYKEELFSRFHIRDSIGTLISNISV